MQIEWVQIVIAAIGGGAVTPIFNYFIAKRQEDRNDETSHLKEYNNLINTYRELYELVSKEVQSEVIAKESILKELESVKGELASLKAKLMLFENRQFSLPVPMWIKDTSGIMLSMNQAYEDYVLTPLNKNRYDYIGKTDEQFWGEELGKKYRQNDLKAHSSQDKVFVGYEDVLTSTGDIVSCKVVKFVQYVGGKPVTYSGMLIPPYIDKVKHATNN